MTMLGEWIKQLIIIVMVSIIADMLLPTKSMQKYVRAVLGIAIIAAMIQPLTPFFRQDWADKMASTASSELMKDTSASNGTGSDISLAGYQHELVSEQQTETNVMVADAVLESLPQALRAHVARLSVANGSTPSELQATVDVDTSDAKICAEIQQSVMQALEVPSTQVVVRQNGGD
ncbi:stage III sporulation protein AF [Alicyclobacillus fastidiosus]|uniref:Stage III sporulation protein AF n=1 Tax=Alicyclobacillus fastidiosus TaxID=392011 RepID=A0ABV5AG14_9BACL|nr:stage III sporulation protein AF [Alicyclobacillus fastidiosus]WEH11712.1 stage III sporulation protein AF [Alicyclobacillus fastidiosus]